MKRKLKILLFCLAAVIAIPLLIYYSLESLLGECITHKISPTNATLRVLHEAVNMFKLETGRYPTQQEGLWALVQEPDGVENWPAGGYLETQQIPLDSWKHEFIYIRYPDPNQYHLKSSASAPTACLAAKGKMRIYHPLTIINRQMLPVSLCF